MLKSKYVTIRTPLLCLTTKNKTYWSECLVFRNRKQVHLVKESTTKTLCGLRRVRGNYVLWNEPHQQQVYSQLSTYNLPVCGSCIVATL